MLRRGSGHDALIVRTCMCLLGNGDTDSSTTVSAAGAAAVAAAAAFCPARLVRLSLLRLAELLGLPFPSGVSSRRASLSCICQFGFFEESFSLPEV